MNGRPSGLDEGKKKKQKKKGPKEISLTKIKQWMIPADAYSYKVLRSLGIPLTKFHERMLPTVRLLLDKKKIAVKRVNFKDEILEPWLDKLASSWLSIDVPDPSSLKCTVSNREMKFKSKGNFERIRKSIDKLEEIIDAFFKRWGYSYTAQRSEGKADILFNVSFELSAFKNPVIEIEAPEPEARDCVIEFGRTRLKFKFGPQNVRSTTVAGRAPEVSLTVEISQGGKWVGLHTQHCTYSEVSSVLPLLQELVKIPNFNDDNLEQISEQD